MIKTSTTGYITIKRYDFYGAKAIPTKKVRTVDGKTQAEFMVISGTNPERFVWLSREEIGI